MTITVDKLRADVDSVLSSVVSTGEPVDVQFNGQLVRIMAASRLSRVQKRDVVVGDPEDLVEFDWSSEWKPNADH